MRDTICDSDIPVVALSYELRTCRWLLVLVMNSKPRQSAGIRLDSDLNEVESYFYSQIIGQS